SRTRRKTAFICALGPRRRCAQGRTGPWPATILARTTPAVTTIGARAPDLSIAARGADHGNKALARRRRSHGIRSTLRGRLYGDWGMSGRAVAPIGTAQ